MHLPPAPCNTRGGARGAGGLQQACWLGREARKDRQLRGCGREGGTAEPSRAREPQAPPWAAPPNAGTPGRRVRTICTHSMRGSRTDWFPERLTTQAGVSGVVSSSAITASMPILLLCAERGAGGAQAGAAGTEPAPRHAHALGSQSHTHTHTHTHAHTHTHTLEASGVSDTVYSRNGDLARPRFTAAPRHHFTGSQPALLGGRGPRTPGLQWQGQGWTGVSGVLSTMTRFLAWGSFVTAVLVCVQTWAWAGGPDQLKQVRTILHGDKSQTGVLPRPTGTDRRARDQGPRLSSVRQRRPPPPPRPQTAPPASHTGQVYVGNSPGESSCVPREPCDGRPPVTHCVQVSPCRTWARGPALSCTSGAPLSPTQASGVPTICKTSR